MDRDDALDAALAAVATGLHVAAASAADYLPPDDVFTALIGGLPVVLGVVAVVLLVVRSDRRGLQAACVLAWLLVLFTLPAFSICLTLVPAAVVLSVAVFRPRLSSARPAGG